MECKGCTQGILMCHNRPCMGTPEEFEKIIQAGYAKKLRIDYWVGAGEKHQVLEEIPELKAFLNLNFNNPYKENVEFLCGGTEKDIEDYRAPFIPTGTCKFLTEDNLCELHSVGLKPEQGRESCCNDEVSEAKDNLYYVHLWATPKGKEVLQLFKDTVGIE